MAVAVEGAEAADSVAAWRSRRYAAAHRDLRDRAPSTPVKLNALGVKALRLRRKEQARRTDVPPETVAKKSITAAGLPADVALRRR